MTTEQPENRRVAVIGLESITATEIYSLFVSGRIRDVVLIGAGAERLITEFRELNAMVPLSSAVKLSQARIDEAASAGIAVIGGSADAGCGTLVDLRKAVAEVRRAVESLYRAGFPGIILVTGTPIELLVRAAAECSPIPSEKIFGIGNRTDLSAVVSRLSSGRASERMRPPVFSGAELPKGWCNAASADVRYIDHCTADCPFFESLLGKPSVAAPFEMDAHDHSPQKLAACVTQVCESVIDDLHTAAPVFVYKDGIVEPSVRVISRNGLENGLPDPAASGTRRDEVAADAIWSMVNADNTANANCA